jgi:hypothetical protein
MRILGLIFSFLLTVSLATLALIYLEQRAGQQRIAVQDEWLSSDAAPAAPVAVAAPSAGQP